MGYEAGGELYITGRVKDVVIRAGRNIHPHELEQSVGEVDGVRRGCVAVFGSAEAETGTERLVLVAETRERDETVRRRMVDEIESLSVDSLGIPIDEVVLAAPHSVLKTSSGKIRRGAVRTLFEEGRLSSPTDPIWGPGWIQWARLAAAAARTSTRKMLREAAHIGYVAYSWLLLAGIASAAWPAVVLSGSEGLGQGRARVAGRFLLRFTGIHLTVDGVDRLPRRGNFVLVSNHASYLDGLVVITALPGEFRLVAKSELRESTLARLFLESIGCQFVDRFDPARSADGTRLIGESLGANHTVGVFAEGTLHRMPGLLPFQLGAFVAAVQAGVPVVPVILRGTRSVLRDGSWAPRRGPVRVRVSEPIAPAEPVPGRLTDWERAVALRDAVRAEILRYCGEPDLLDRRPLLDLADARKGK